MSLFKFLGMLSIIHYLMERTSIKLDGISLLNVIILTHESSPNKKGGEFEFNHLL